MLTTQALAEQYFADAMASVIDLIDNSYDTGGSSYLYAPSMSEVREKPAHHCDFCAITV